MEGNMKYRLNEDKGHMRYRLLHPHWDFRAIDISIVTVF